MNAAVLPKPAGVETADVVMSASACGAALRSVFQQGAGVAPTRAGRVGYRVW